MSIPTDRPFNGDDLQFTKMRLGLNTNEMLYHFGLSMHKWSKLTREEGDPVLVGDPAIGIMARFACAHPERIQIPPMPNPADVMDFINAGTKQINLKEFGMSFGRDGSAGYRWITRGSSVTPLVTRLMNMVVEHLEDACGHSMHEVLGGYQLDAKERAALTKAWEEFRRHVDEEARARGVVDTITAHKLWPRIKESDSEDGEEE